MTTQRKWLLVLSVIAAAAAALAVGVRLDTLLLMGAVLLCPAAMYFGMQGMGMQQGCGHGGKCNHSDAPGAIPKTETRERPKAA